MKNRGRILLKFLCALAALFVSHKATPSLADRRIKFVASLNDEFVFTELSPSSNYVARKKYLDNPSRTQFQVLQFRKGRRNYTPVGSVVYSDLSTSPNLCSVSDRGEVTIYDEMNDTLATYNKSGNLIASKSTPDGCTGYAESAPKGIGGITERRRVLCSLPASSRVVVPGGLARVHDILSIRHVFSTGQVLAEIITDPIDAQYLKFSSFGRHSELVLIDPENYRSNFCLASKLEAATGESKCGLRLYQEAPGFRVGAFLSQFGLINTYDNNNDFETPIYCKFALSVSNATKLANSDVQIAVEWLGTEYSDPEITNSISLYGKQGIAELVINVNRYYRCGHVVKLKPANPMIRSDTYSIGDLWCSHY